MREFIRHADQMLTPDQWKAIGRANVEKHIGDIASSEGDLRTEVYELAFDAMCDQGLNVIASARLAKQIAKELTES